MALNLTDKERRLLEDQKKHESLCIQKYQSYARMAQSPQLKQLFNSYAQQEQTHLDTINQLLNGQLPNMNQQGQSGQGQQSGQTQQSGQAGQSGQTQQSGQAGQSAANQGGTSGNAFNGQIITVQGGNTVYRMDAGTQTILPYDQAVMLSGNEASICNDMLMMEKYVSGAYDIAIFEFTDTNVRQALNHIQKEEQQHGEGLYNYMKSRGLYNQQ